MPALVFGAVLVAALVLLALTPYEDRLIVGIAALVVVGLAAAWWYRRRHGDG